MKIIWSFMGKNLWTFGDKKKQQIVKTFGNILYLIE